MFTYAYGDKVYACVCTLWWQGLQRDMCYVIIKSLFIYMYG